MKTLQQINKVYKDLLFYAGFFWQTHFLKKSIYF